MKHRKRGSTLSSPEKPKHEEGWFTLREIRQFLGWKAKSAPENYLQAYPQDKKQWVGNTPYYHAPTFMAIVIDRKAKPSDPDDPMYGDADSPNLERWRAAKAEREEIALAKDKGNVAPVSAVIELYSIVASSIRHAAENAQRECGTRAFEIFIEGLNEADKRIQEAFPHHDNGETDGVL